MLSPELRHTNEDVYQDLLAITQEVEEKIKSGNITYDEYMEIQLKHLKGKDNDFIRSLSRLFVNSSNKANDSSTWTDTNLLFDQVKNIDINYGCLLTDPLILCNINKFMKFIEDKPLYDPIELRRKFIETFPVKTYYRGIVMTDDKEEYPNGHLAPKIRKMVQGSRWLNDYKLSLQNTNKDIERYSKNGGSYLYLYNTPLLNRFEERVLRHVGDRQTDNEVVSVSELPEIAWYASSHNGKELWRSWDKKRFLRVCKFQMNSFYAPSSIDLVWSRLDGFNKDDPKKIKFQDTNGVFEISVLNQKIEQLVPISLPQDFDQDYVDFRPEWDESRYRPSSFKFPRESDW